MISPNAQPVLRDTVVPQYECSPILGAHNFADLGKTYQAAKPFPWICIDNFLTPTFANELADAYPDYVEAAGIGREFRAINEVRKVQIVDPDKYPDPVLQLHRFFSSDSWLARVSEMTSIARLVPDPDMNGGGMHLYANGAILDVHVDFNYMDDSALHRRLNILLFLNRNWRTEWGGQFEIWNEDVSEIGAAIEPVFNRCVLFETSEKSYHGVRKVNCPDDVSRNSFAAYYYTKEPPAGWDGATHSTIFVARPKEKLKRALMPVERYINLARMQSRRVMRKLRK